MLEFEFFDFNKVQFFVKFEQDRVCDLVRVISADKDMIVDYHFCGPEINADRYAFSRGYLSVKRDF